MGGGIRRGRDGYDADRSLGVMAGRWCEVK